jgi:hypothetical protein
MNVQPAGSFIEFEGETFTAVAFHAGIHIFRLLLGKLHGRATLDGMTRIAALDVATLAVQVIVRDVGYAHESVRLFIPVTHTIAGKMQALVEEGQQTRAISIGSPQREVHQ